MKINNLNLNKEFIGEQQLNKLEQIIFPEIKY